MLRTASHVLVAMLDVKVNLVRDLRALRFSGRRAEQCGDGEEHESKGKASELHPGDDLRVVTRRWLVKRTVASASAGANVETATWLQRLMGTDVAANNGTQTVIRAQCWHCSSDEASDWS